MTDLPFYRSPDYPPEFDSLTLASLRAAAYSINSHLALLERAQPPSTAREFLTLLALLIERRQQALAPPPRQPAKTVQEPPQ